MEEKRASIEEKIYNSWVEKRYFKTKISSKKKPYGLLIPPPNLTGELHLGHALQHSILDAVARFKRLQGFEVLLLPGVDHAGIQFEATFDKHLQKQGLSKQKIRRDEWLKRAWKFKDEIYDSVSKSWRLMGISADWSREVFSLDLVAKRAVFKEFKTFFDNGLIYKGPYIVQWCPKCNTAIEDVEMEYEERKEKLYYIKYLLVSGTKKVNSRGFVVVATVRPETIFSDVAVAVNPKDKRYNKLIGEKVLVPFVNREVPIIGDTSVDIKFGSGALKIDPPHSLADYEIGKKNNLEMILSVGKDGKLLEIAGQFVGLKTTESREVISKSLLEKGLLEKVEEIIHAVSVCERCKTVVEPLISEEWFVKVGSMAKDAKEIIRKNEINFLPTDFGRILTFWLSNIHDWCISRSLWWGHRIPVWYPSTSLRPIGSTQGKQAQGRLGQVVEMKVSLESPGEGWVQDEKVLDTWFSSGIWPLISLGWPDSDSDAKKMLNRYYPWSFEISAPEIKFLWIARMIMLGSYFTGKVPFKKMFFHGTLRDLEGRKFSKSLGNGIEPTYLIDKWGVDATRMVLYTYSIPGRDGRVSKNTLDERGKNFRNFVTKLRNIYRFVFEFAPDDEKTPLNFTHKDDIAIKNALEILITRVTNDLDSLNLHLAVEELYNFVWHQFADVYVEKSKTRRVEAQPVLEYIFKNVLILLHPFMPFITEELYLTFKDRQESIVLEKWPS